MKAKKTDAGWFSNRSGLEAVRRWRGRDVRPHGRTPTASTATDSVLIVNAKSRIDLAKVLKCDKTLTFGLGDVLSTSGTLAPMTYLFAPQEHRSGGLLQTGAQRVQSHQANLFAVAKGQLDVATNNSTALLHEQRVRRSRRPRTSA